jgi:hypothetical protein
MSIQPTRPTPNLSPDYTDERTARAAGYRLMTTDIRIPEEREIALAIHATLDGSAPGSRPVQFVIVGDKRRVAFARPAHDLRGLEGAPPPATPALQKQPPQMAA